MYNDFQEWFDAANDLGLQPESWGMFGSKSAHDINGRLRGEWIAAGDTRDGRANGWLDTDKDW